MIEIDIFNSDEKLIKNTVYDVPVKLIIKRDSFRNALNVVKVKNKNYGISFRDVVFKSEVSIYLDEVLNSTIPVSIDFHNCNIDTFTDFALKSKNLSLYFGSSLVHNLRINSGKLKSLTFNNCFGVFFISKVERVHVSYTEENIFPRDWIKGLKTQDMITKLLSFKTSFHLENIQDINFYGNEIDNEFKKKLLIKKELKSFGKFENFVLNKQGSANYKLKRFLSDTEKELLNINIDLKYMVDFNHKKTTIRNLPLSSISIRGKAVGEILIEECRVNNFFIRDFSSLNEFKLYNIQTKSKPNKGKFEVHNSNLDNAWFNLVNLNEYFVVFHKSSFVNTKFYSTVFPSLKELLNSNNFSSIKNIHYPNEKSKPDVYKREMYELFLELKQAMDKRGNVFESQKMRAVSQDYLYRLSSCNIFKSSFYNDTLILLLNRWSNFHGVSIRNALFTSIIVIILFYGFILVSFNSYEIGYNNWQECMSIIYENKRLIFVLANPTHNISSLAPEYEITDSTYAISYFSRIFVGYAYYQFIATFRRFGK